jgi:hypothetical protein
VIFLQLQSGKLDAFGYVDKSSVYWMEEPEDLTTNIRTLNYDMRTFKIAESELVEEGKFMTGESEFFLAFYFNFLLNFLNIFFQNI